MRNECPNFICLRILQFHWLYWNFTRDLCEVILSPQTTLPRGNTERDQCCGTKWADLRDYLRTTYTHLSVVLETASPITKSSCCTFRAYLWEAIGWKVPFMWYLLYHTTTWCHDDITTSNTAGKHISLHWLLQYSVNTSMYNAHKRCI